MKSCLRLGYSGLRVLAGVVSLGIALFYGGIAQAAPQYDITCDTCHRMPPLDSASGTREPITGAVKGNHQTHAGTTALSCGKCHGSGAVTYPTGHRDKTIQVGGNINSSPAVGSYSRGFLNQTSVPPATLGSCANVNCHFESVTEAWGVLPASTYTALGANATTCGKCHGAAPNDGSHPALSGSGKKHGDYYGTGTGSCIKCHPDHAAEGKPFAHATSAGHRGLALRFIAPNSGGNYSKSANLNYPNYLPSQTAAASRNGTCSSLYCHSDGAGGGPNSAATWGGTLPADCSGCHGGNASSANILASGSHGRHMNQASILGSNYECARCHSATVSAGNDRAVTAPASHVDGTKTVAFADGGTYSGGSCSATICHVAGKAAAPQPAAPAWGGAPLDCKGCHGVGGSYGEPSYASGGVAADLANSHTAKHVVSAVSCANCHAATTADGISIKSGAPHADGAINVGFGAAYDLGGAAYTSTVGTKSCANVYCHSNGNGGAPPQAPKWGGSMPADCTGCHGNDATSTSLIATGKHRAHLNNYTTLGRNNYFGCVDCHARTVSGNRTIANPANHANTLKDYSGARAGRIAAAGSGKCSTNYCHSTGQKGAAAIFWNMTAANWYSGRTLDCNGCHGNATPADFAPVAGAPNHANGGQGSNTANSHNKHVAGAGITDSTGCAKCHYRTVDAAVAGKLRNYSTQHLNGVRDVSFSVSASMGGVQGRYSSNSQQCMNTYCHGGAPSANWGSPSLSCNACHSAEYTGFTASSAGAHKLHYQATTPPAAGSYASMPPGNVGTAGSYQFNCTSCHAAPAQHASGAANGNGAGEVYFGYSTSMLKGSYGYGATQGNDNGFKWTNGSCASTYCHSDGNGGAGNDVAFSWASPQGSLGCTGCHGDATTPGRLLSTGKHQKHVNKGANADLGNSIGCVECHRKTVGSNSAIADKTRHVNKFKDYSGAKAYRSGYLGGTCSTYCHSTGASGSEFRYVTQSWTSGTISDCKGCHGSQSGAGYSASSYGEPNYDNLSTATREKFNSHNAKHIKSNADCVLCHVNTVSAAYRIISSATTPSHLNKVRDVNFDTTSPRVGNNSPAYNATAKTCSNVRCHSNGQATPTYVTPRWGATLAGCAGCHPNLSGAHNRHMGLYGLAGIPGFDNITANRSSGAEQAVVSYGLGCANCHPVTESSKHMDGFIDVDLRPAAGAGFLKNRNLAGSVFNADKTCDLVYCHSDGRNPLVAGVNGRAPAWYGSFTNPDRCANCHGNSPTTGAHAKHAVGIHYADIYSGTNGKLAAGSSGSVSHGIAAQATTINCNICHNSTVTSDSNDRNTVCSSCHGSSATPRGNAAIANLGNHVNGRLDLAFKSIAVVSKAQLSPEYFGNYSAASAFWTRNGGNYKNGPAAFDTAKTALDTASMWSAGNCSNIACHMGKTVNWYDTTITCVFCHSTL